MIQINDYDEPINVAEKIIYGTTVEVNGSTEDMFEMEDIKEIADYLLVYYQSHQKR